MRKHVEAFVYQLHDLSKENTFDSLEKILCRQAPSLGIFINIIFLDREWCVVWELTCASAER